MSLKEQLTTLKENMGAQIPQDVLSILVDEAKTLSESDLVKFAPKVGEKVIDFNLTNQLGNAVSLSSLRKKGPVVVTFYRGGWCPYCSLQLKSYQEILSDIKAAGATLVAITPELPDASLSTSEKLELELEIITDVNADYARELGLVFTLPEVLRPIYEAFGIFIEKHNGAGQFDIPLAATFVVNVDGIITYAFVNTDYTLRAEPSDILKELEALA